MLFRSYLLARLTDLAAAHPAIGNVRGLGLFIGVELVSDRDAQVPDAAAARFVANRMRDRGILLSTDGPLHNVLKIKPPMVITNDDLDMVVRALDDELARAHSG